MIGSRSSGTSSSSINTASWASVGGARGDGAAARVTRLRNPGPAAIHPADRLRADPPTRRSTTLSSRSDLFRTHARRACPRRRRRDGHDAPGGRPLDGRLPGPRGVQRDPQRHPARHRPQRPRRLLRGGRRLRRDQHLRRQPTPTSASTTSPTGSTSWPTPARGSRPSRPQALVDRRAAAVRHRLGGPGHQAALAGARAVRPAARRVRRAGPRHDRRRGRRHPHRDLAGPAAGQGRRHRRPARAGRRRRDAAGHGAGDGRDDRHDAHGLARSARR